MARKFTTHPDQDYDVTVCRNCKHPGGQGRRQRGTARWNDAMTREAEEHAGITREGEEDA